jgi:hypothetical protein
MITNKSIEQINSELQNLWADHLKNKKVYAPTQYEEPQKAGLVFVGMNPSFSEKGWKTLLRRSETPDLEAL